MANIDSLSDAILICILSFLPTKVAARSSVISKRWRHLWTGVTAVELELQQSLYCIILILSLLQTCMGKVEEVHVTSAYFTVPRCIFQCETLVNLDLNISQRCTFYKLTTINLPKLKLLCFSFRGGNSFDSIAMLIKSCPLLETLKMTLESLFFHNALALRSKLTYLCLVDNGLLIDFVTNSTELDSAYIVVTYVAFFSDWGLVADDVVGNFSKFFVQLCSIFEFHLESNVKIFSHMHLVNSLPVFRNLSSATTMLTRRSGVIDFLLFLQIAPNLKEVIVTLNYNESNPLADMTQSAVVVPELLLNNLDCVNITGLQGNNDEVNLLGYILKNATVLNEL
ncbi:hypothetical protein RDABS01_027245 [Bienertia sinuspersici]